MSATFEMGICPAIRWKVDFTQKESLSPKFRLGKTEYRLESSSLYDQISLWFLSKSITPVCSSITVHVVSCDTGQILPSLTCTVLKPIPCHFLFQKKIRDIKDEYPDFNYRELVFIVTFQELSVTDEESVQISLSINPISCSESLSDDWEKLLQLDSDSNPDVEFRCDGHYIKAHKLVVGVRSPVLAKMLQSQMVEGKTGVIKIEDIDFDTLKIFVRYLYSGRLDEEPTFELALVLYETADKYNVQSLAKRCAWSLVEKLTVENACEVLDLADQHSDHDFMEKVVVFVLEKKVPLTSKHWSSFCSSHPLLVIDIYKRFSEMYVKNTDPITTIGSKLTVRNTVTRNLKENFWFSI